MSSRSARVQATTVALAAVLALGASVALAQGKSDTAGDEVELPIGKRACLAAGCDGGNRACGSVSWTEWVWIWTPWVPIPWKITEFATCYETAQEK